MRNVYSIIFVVAVLSFYLGRISLDGSTFLAATDNNSGILEQEKMTLEWLKEIEPLNYAKYKVSYLREPFDENTGVEETVSFFNGYYYLPNKGGYFQIESPSRVDLDGDDIEEGVVVKFGSYGGTGSFPVLVVLKKTDLGFTEAASTS
ncbi:hypothetical protein HY844_02090 [Candidatus Berkelbacteria bacterium]|nr:hypothetical protein [Candidatus Berkelbacteria bacterium]